MATAVDTPSPADTAAQGNLTPQSDDIAHSGPSAPSDFLKHLPSSANRPYADAEPDLDSEVVDNGTAAPSKVQFDSHGRTLNPRSCVTCRKRKVKCDKVHPCSNCSRAHIECVFPAPGRAPRKIRKVGDVRDKELLERLRRLEGVVKGMGVEVPRDEKDGTSMPDSRASVEPRAQADGADGNSDVQNGTGANSLWFGRNDDIDHQHKVKWVEERQDRNFENRFGRLVVNEGKSRYINNSFWANLSNEVEDLKGILNQASDDEDVDSPVANQQQGGNHQGWVFGFNSQNVDLLALHPLPGKIRDYWDTFKDRVDPLVKVLHIPSIEPTILSAASNLTHLSRGFECLLFAIYYGATTSLNPSDCLKMFGEDKSVLLARYRFAIQQALARANFLNTEEIIVLQAFVVFLICLRRNNDARVIWTLTGLVVRIAQTIGVHRDGSHFGLAPFEVEMRRRLWWQVCILDTRASEDHGCDPTIIEQAFDTKMPLNVNDSDMTPDMKDFPPERQGCTDMSFCLIRFEVANTFRRINYIPPGPPKACTDYFANVTLADKEKWITECHVRLEERYLKHCDMTVPLFWVTATVARLMMSKMWLMVYHPFQRHDGGASLPQETKEKLFITSLENIEYSLLLETESRTMKWGWLFKTYMQWHALAFILSELCHKTTGDLVERAWTAVEKTRDGRWGMHITADSPTGHLWRPLKKLYRKAAEARKLGLHEEMLAKQRTAVPMRTYSPKASGAFEVAPKPQMTSAPQGLQMQHGPEYGQLKPDKHDPFMQAKPMNVATAAGSNEPHSTAMDVSDQPSGGETVVMQTGMPPKAENPNVRQPHFALQQQQQQQQQGMQDLRHPQPQLQPQPQPQPQPQSHPRQGNGAAAPQPFSSPTFYVSPNNSSPNLMSPGRNSRLAFNSPTNPNHHAHNNQQQQQQQQQQQHPFSSTPNNLSSSSLASLANHANNNQQHMRMSSSSYDSGGLGGWDANIGPGDPDLSAMDTSGDLNWENWDQLVKQFGMNVDPRSGDGGMGFGGGGGAGAGAGMADWTGQGGGGGHWDGSNAGRMGMGMGTMGMGMGGMGSGDWF